MAEFVYRGGAGIGLPPFIATGARMYCFAIPCSAKAVNERILGPCYNQVSGGELNYRLVLDTAFITFVQIPSLRSGTPPQDQWGYSSEQEMAIWLLALDVARLSLVWLQPYIVVDNTVAMSSGREVYGFPKSVGQFTMPRWPSELAQAPHEVAEAIGPSFDCETLVMPKYEYDCKGQVKSLVGASSGRRHGGRPLTWSSMREAVGSILHLVGQEAEKDTHLLVEDALAFLRHPVDTSKKALHEIEAAVDYSEHLLAGDVPLMLLKQMPTAGASGAAVYQSVVHVDSRLTGFRGGGLLPHDYTVSLGDYDSHPVARDLGVSGRKQKARLSYYLDFDFDFMPGKVMWP